MRRHRWVTSGLLAAAIALSLVTSGYGASGSGSETGAGIAPGPVVALRAASNASIGFREQNGQPANGASSPSRHVPHLVLRRNGALTEPEERTLVVEVGDINVPPPGVTVTLHIETQHGDPDPRDEAEADPAFPTALDSGRISVWRQARWISNSSPFTHTGVTAVFSHTFQESIVSAAKSIDTPTDYFRYQVTVSRAGRSITSPGLASRATLSASVSLSQNHAFLLENQWIAPLPAVQETLPGAAPDELIIYYTDMVPFLRSSRDPATWLPRADVDDFVSLELVPKMVEAFRVQTDEWGFPWHPAWTSYRPGDDSERLSVALSDGRTWFHGRAPRRANSLISIRVAGGENASYETLAQGLLSAFHHELFHNVQRNIQQSFGGRGAIDGAEGAWRFFSEGTAVLASSVGQADVEFAGKKRAYLSNANGYVGYEGFFAGLNRSYDKISPYHASIYWRFLYEQCGQTEDGGLDPAAGMAVVRSALTVLYSGDVVDISASTDLVRALPEIMDRALSNSPCPLETHEESLSAFTRAVYALRLDGGRCEKPGIKSGCGFYDPHDFYNDPAIHQVTYAGTEEQLSGEIPSSFGVDFVEVILSEALDGRPLTLEVHGPVEDTADITVQVWELKGAADDARPGPAPTPTPGPSILSGASRGGQFSYTTPAVDAAVSDMLGLIITRVDAHEHLDPVGAYTIVLR